MTPAELPPPLVPAEVDLRDFGFMPLDVVRLRDSGLTAKASGDEFRAAVLLWCAAWHQQPAASLPDDDDELANLCGYGRARREWANIRDGALRGFVKCSDGRLYHPMVATKANEAWLSKQAQRARTEAARKAREAARQSQSQALSHTPPISVTEPVTESKGQGQGQGQGQGIEKKPPDGGSGPAHSAEPPAPPPAFDGKNAEVLNGKAVVPLSAAWELPEAWGIDAEALGWKPSEVLREAEKLRQWATAGKGAGTRRSVKGWRQTWSNWLDKAAKDRR